MRLFVLCTGCALFATAPLASAVNQFNIVGSKIYDPNGTEFLARGINIPGYNHWVGHDPSPDANLIADAWGFNLVRVNTLPVTPPELPGAFINIDNIVRAFTTDRIAAGKAPVVVMIAPHESTDKYFEGQQLADVTAWFRHQAYTYRDNPYVWFNVGNEPGNKQKPADWPEDQFWDIFQPDQEKWETMHQTVIKAIREDVGNRNIIVADGVSDGQDSPWDDKGTLNPAHSAIISFGRNLINFGGKTYQNILFDTHIYGMWISEGSTPDRLDQYIRAVREQNLALIFGEYNPNTPGTYKMANDMVMLADQYRIGRAGWHWVDAGAMGDLTLASDPTAVGRSWETGGGYLIDDPTNPTNLSQWGQFLWTDNRNLPDALRQLLPGDANDDGQINADDYVLIDRGFLTPYLDGWVNGDFDNSGTIGAEDYLIIDTAFVRSGGTLSAEVLDQREALFGSAYMDALQAAVPEPAGATVAFAVAAATALTRRRRQNVT